MTVSEVVPKLDGSRGRNLLWRVLSALVLAPLAVGAAYLGGWAVLVFWGIAAFGVFWEWITLFSAMERRLVFGLGATAITLAGLMGWIGRIRLPFFIIILGGMAIGVLARTSQRSWIVAGVLYAGTLVAAPAALTREAQYAFSAMMFVMIIVWMTDIFAYAGGRLVGGPRVCPAISPNKTWSGAIAGTVAGVIGGIVVARCFGLPNVAALGLIACVLSILAQVGDFFESYVKRQRGAKDAGNIIPGHGGLMDRLDGFVFAVFVAAVIGIVHGGFDHAGAGLLLW